MRLLLDTNIFLEIILGQSKAEDAKTLLSQTAYDMFVSDFSLHSIGLMLVRQQLHNVFRLFLADLLLNTGVTMLSLFPEEMDAIIDTATTFNLDFDDAYQYALAERYDLTIVSFDSDFDRTTRGRQSPTEIIRRG